MARTRGPSGSESRVETGGDLRLVLRAAAMYHLEGATQAEIASRLGISRPTAGRLIARARSAGLVRVVFDIPEHLATSVHTELERELEQRYGLDEVVVVEDEVDYGNAAAMAALGRATADVLTRRIQPGDVLGFTWGPETVALADAISGRPTSCRAVVQLDGSMTQSSYRTGVDHVLSRLCSALGAEPFRLLAPLYADPATAAALRADSFISKPLRLGEEADVMVFGCGHLSTDTTLFEGAYIDQDDIAELTSLGAVGEIAGQFYGPDGADITSSLSARTVSVPLEKVRACPLTILTTGGSHKHTSILAAVRGGLAKVLVTDHACARWLNEQEDTR